MRNPALLLLYFIGFCVSAQKQTLGANLEMVWVKGGVFNMGSTTGKCDERPIHAVKLHSYFIGRYEVTQGLWKEVMGNLPKGCSDGEQFPVYNASPEMIDSFLQKLYQLTGKPYRLPTEAEWEYAAQGGNKSLGYKYSGSNNLEVAWYRPNGDMKTHPVGLRKPNELGIYDMSGNVWELCRDWYEKNFYRHSTDENPVQLKKRLYRLVRGGSWRSEEQRCQIRARNVDVYDHHISNGGFRLVLDANEAEQSSLPEPLPFTSWVDSMANYARNVYLPARKYQWNWQHAALLQTLVRQYDKTTEPEKQLYFNYIKRAMDKNKSYANGKMPNAVASGLGMAFLYRVTGWEKYKKKCEKIYRQYLNSKRTKEGAVSHVPVFSELWDDTVFMVGEFLLAMYRATGNEKYLDELALQIALHREKLLVKEWGLWVHGYDQQGWGHCLFCSQVHWGKTKHKSSYEIWGRGNGWILITLSDALHDMPANNAHRKEFEGYLREMVQHLPELQDKQTGHWHQLPIYPGDKDNFMESSCTAMFGYGIQTAIQLGLVSGSAYTNSVEQAYLGLRRHSILKLEGSYLTVKNICRATCIGNKTYYYKRKVTQGKAYGLAAFILFSSAYEQNKGHKFIGIK
jgi:unsaturated rhamnogalacturonyl hydrolase